MEEEDEEGEMLDRAEGGSGSCESSNRAIGDSERTETQSSMVVIDANVEEEEGARQASTPAPPPYIPGGLGIYEARVAPPTYDDALSEPAANHDRSCPPAYRARDLPPPPYDDFPPVDRNSESGVLSPLTYASSSDDHNELSSDLGADLPANDYSECNRQNPYCRICEENSYGGVPVPVNPNLPTFVTNDYGRFYLVPNNLYYVDLAQVVNESRVAPVRPSNSGSYAICAEMNRSWLCNGQLGQAPCMSSCRVPGAPCGGYPRGAPPPPCLQCAHYAPLPPTPPVVGCAACSNGSPAVSCCTPALPCGACSCGMPPVPRESCQICSPPVPCDACHPSLRHLYGPPCCYGCCQSYRAGAEALYDSRYGNVHPLHDLNAPYYRSE